MAVDAIYPPAFGFKDLPDRLIDRRGITRDGDSVIRIPFLTATGELYNVHCLDEETGRRWWLEPGRPVIPYLLDELPSPDQRVGLALGIFEGESDALAFQAVCVFYSYRCLAVPGASTWRPEWARYAENFDVVYVFGDGDEAGEALAEKVLADVPTGRRVMLPAGQDVRSTLQGDPGPMYADGAGLLFHLLEAADAVAAELAWLHRVGAAIEQSETLDECKQLLASGLSADEIRGDPLARLRQRAG